MSFPKLDIRKLCTLSQPSFCRKETALAIAPLLDPRDLISLTFSGRRPCQKTLGCPAARPVRGSWQSSQLAHSSAVPTSVLRRSTQCACWLAVSAKRGSRRRVHLQQRFSIYVSNYVNVIVAVDDRGLIVLMSPTGLSTLRLSSRASTWSSMPRSQRRNVLPFYTTTTLLRTVLLLRYRHRQSLLAVLSEPPI